MLSGMCQNKESLSFRHGLHGNSRIILFLSPYIPRNPCLKANKKSASFNYDTPSWKLKPMDEAYGLYPFHKSIGLTS